MSINPEHLATRIAKFRDDRRALQEMVVACFPIGSKVRIKETNEVGVIKSTVAHAPDLLHVWIYCAPDWFGRCPAVSVADLERFDDPS